MARGKHVNKIRESMCVRVFARELNVRRLIRRLVGQKLSACGWLFEDGSPNSRIFEDSETKKERKNA